MVGMEPMKERALAKVSIVNEYGQICLGRWTDYRAHDQWSKGEPFEECDAIPKSG